MICRLIFILIYFFVISCADNSKKNNLPKKFINYSNKGFALIYDEKLFKKDKTTRYIRVYSIIDQTIGFCLS